MFSLLEQKAEIEKKKSKEGKRPNTLQTIWVAANP